MLKLSIQLITTFQTTFILKIKIYDEQRLIVWSATMLSIQIDHYIPNTFILKIKIYDEQRLII